MAETLNIGGRLHSTETGNVVAGANEILDDSKGKKQSQVNAETDAILQAHTSAINAFESGNFLTLVATDADADIAAVFTRLGVTPAVNIVYRIANWKHNDADTKYNTAYYSEYAANGTTTADLVPISVENKGIDDEPTVESNNLVKSGGIVEWGEENYGKHIENPEFIAINLDANGRLLEGIRRNGTKVFPVDLEIGGRLNGIRTKVTENKEFFCVETDALNRILGGRKKNGVRVEFAGLDVANILLIGKKGYNIESVLDSEGKEVSARRKDGVLIEHAGIETKYVRSKSLFSNVANFHTIETDNIYHSYLPFLRSLNRPILAYHSQFPRTDYKPLVLSVITDWHNYKDSVKRFCDFNHKYAGYIDGNLCLGDICQQDWTSYQNDLESYKGYKNIMISIGNHDVYNYNNEAIESGHSYNDRDYWASDEEKYKRYIKPVEKLNCVYTVNKCYYYRDFAFSNVRLIVVDVMGWDNDQKEWLISCLADARTNGYHVVVAQHIPALVNSIDPNNDRKLLNYDGFDCTFESYDIYTMASNEQQCNPDAVEIVQDFIDNGGVFVCWLFGHWHTDSVGVLEGYPKQIYIVQEGDVAGEAPFQDTERVNDTFLQDVFNIFSVDYSTRTIRLLRIGATIDRHLRHKESLIISYDYGSDYNNIKVINNN